MSADFSHDWATVASSVSSSTAMSTSSIRALEFYSGIGLSSFLARTVDKLSLIDGSFITSNLQVASILLSSVALSQEKSCRPLIGIN